MHPHALYVHEISRASYVNGPGLRAVVWVQGCSIGCPGCFNPQTHPSGSSGAEVDPVGLGQELARLQVTGLTVSGGEPLEQPEAVHALMTSFRNAHPGTVLLFTGFSLDAIMRAESAKKAVLAADAVLSGPYVAGSDAQSIWNRKQLFVITGRISPYELAPERALEITADKSNRFVISGYPDATQRTAIRNIF